MKRFLHPCIWLLIVAILLPVASMTSVAMGQEDVSKDPSAAAADQEPAPPSAYDVAVQTIVRSDPVKPADLTMAVANLLRFERPDLAKQYLTKLIELELDEETQAELGAAVGSEVLSRIINSGPLGPEAAEFGLSVLRSYRESLNDPDRLEALAEQAVSDNPQQRYLAIVELRRSGLAGVTPLVQILADDSRSKIHTFAREALIRFGAPVAAPLVAVLETKNPVLKQNVARVLAQVRGAGTARYLYADAWAGSDESVRRTAKTAVRMLDGRVTLVDEAHRALLKDSRDFVSTQRRVDVDVNGMTTSWIWNDTDQQLTRIEEHPAVASARIAARLARELARLVPNDEEVLSWQLTAELHLLKLVTGLDTPLGPNVASMISPRKGRSAAAQLNDVLAEALRTDAGAAAIAAAELLGQLARAGAIEEDLFVQADGHPAPLALALRHADRRAQLAAASTIVALNRHSGFAGAGALVGVLRPLANYSGVRQAVVADPRGNRGDQLAALLTERGFEARSFTTGRGLYQGAVLSGENELALIAYTIDKPDVRRLIERLRNDARTANLPIGLIVTPEQRLEANILAEQYPMVETFLRPRDSEAMRQRIEDVLSITGLAYVPPEVRTEQARVALTLLAELTARPSPHDLRGIEPAVANALFHPQLSALAAKVLGQINSHQAQLALVEFASINALPVVSRKAAVAGFSESLARNGIHLSYDEIKNQSVRYDDSEGLDKETQDVLWSILDALQSIKRRRPENPGSVPRRG